jgi:hypothetical protein
VDGFLEEVKQQLDAQGLSQTRAIIVQQDGTWKPKAEVRDPNGVSDRGMSDESPTPVVSRASLPAHAEIIDLSDWDCDNEGCFLFLQSISLLFCFHQHRAFHVDEYVYQQAGVSSKMHFAEFVGEIPQGFPSSVWFSAWPFAWYQEAGFTTATHLGRCLPDAWYPRCLGMITVAWAAKTNTKLFTNAGYSGEARSERMMVFDQVLPLCFHSGWWNLYVRII